MDLKLIKKYWTSEATLISTWQEDTEVVEEGKMEVWGFWRRSFSDLQHWMCDGFVYRHCNMQCDVLELSRWLIQLWTCLLQLLNLLNIYCAVSRVE